MLLFCQSLKLVPLVDDDIPACPQGLLLLIQLTRNNNNIQKIVAFENAFERLLDIVVDEGNSDGGRLLVIWLECLWVKTFIGSSSQNLLMS